MNDKTDDRVDPYRLAWKSYAVPISFSGTQEEQKEFIERIKKAAEEQHRRLTIALAEDLYGATHDPSKKKPSALRPSIWKRFSTGLRFKIYCWIRGWEFDE